MLSHFRAPSWRFCVQLPVIYLKLTKANNRDRFTSGFWMFPNGVQIFCYFPFWYAVTCCWVTIAGLLASCGIFVLLLGISGTFLHGLFLNLTEALRNFVHTRIGILCHLYFLLQVFIVSINWILLFLLNFFDHFFHLVFMIDLLKHFAFHHNLSLLTLLNIFLLHLTHLFSIIKL